MSGPPFSLYHSWKDKKVVVEVGFPTAGAVEGEGHLRSISLSVVKAVTGIHIMTG